MAKILVVDDEPDIRLLVRFALSTDAHDVVEAADGREALDEIASQHPDLIVLDVMMPQLSGWEVLETVKADPDPDVREIPIIMLTALGTPMDRAKGGIEGAVRYLAKPISPDDLRASVADALAGDPEPVQRRRAQQRALEDLARMERGDTAPAPPPVHALRPRLTGLQGLRSVEPRHEATPASTADLRRRAEELTVKQRELLAAISRTPTVLAAAAELDMSRSNVYASLRRIARRLEVASVGELLDHVRSGRIVD